MPKRRHEETKEERWQRKRNRYEAKLEKRRRRRDDEEQEAENAPEAAIEPTAHSSNDPAPPQPAEARRLPEHPQPPEDPTPTDEFEATAGVVDIPVDESPLNLDVDPELLEALGTFQEEATEWGEPIVDHIAMRLKPLLLDGFKKEEKETVIKKYPFPKNIHLAKAPTLNAEISTMLTEQSRNRDKRLYVKQNQLGVVLSAVTKAMSLLLCKEPKIVDILSILSDASKLLADSHFLETDTRRSLITPLVDKELIDSFKNRKRDDYLFGDKLGELVKNSRGIKKTGQLIQASSSNFLNNRGPSSRGRPQKNFASRGGGQQRPHRRAAPYGPPPASQRRQQQAQPAPPPPVPPRRRHPPASAGTWPRSSSATGRTNALP